MEFLKKGVIVVLSVFLCIAGLSPQVFAAPDGMNRISLSGVNVKLGITSTSAPEIPEGDALESGVGFVLGISSDRLAIPILNNVVLQPEFLIVRKRFNIITAEYGEKTITYAYSYGGYTFYVPETETVPLNSTSIDECSATYFEIPLLCKVNMDISQCTFSFYMGPYLGLKMTDSIPKYAKDLLEFQTATIGITVGESVMVQNISFEVRYDEGLTSWIEGKSGTEYDGAEFKSHTWMFMVGYQF